MWCYRKNGHNETDEPNFTQPLLYQRVRKQVTVMRRYADVLQSEGVISKADVDAMHEELVRHMDEAQTRIQQILKG